MKNVRTWGMVLGLKKTDGPLLTKGHGISSRARQCGCRCSPSIEEWQYAMLAKKDESQPMESDRRWPRSVESQMRRKCLVDSRFDYEYNANVSLIFQQHCDGWLYFLGTITSYHFSTPLNHGILQPKQHAYTVDM